MRATDAEPVIVTDTREQTPLCFTHLRSERGTLDTGDYSVRGLEEVFAVERKSMADLVGSLTRERARFMREMHRLRGFSFARLLVIGTEMDLARLVAQGRANLAQVEHSLLSLEYRYNVPVVRAETATHAALLVETWGFVAWRNLLARIGRKVAFPEWAAGVLIRGERRVTA